VSNEGTINGEHKKGPPKAGRRLVEGWYGSNVAYMPRSFFRRTRRVPARGHHRDHRDDDGTSVGICCIGRVSVPI
jgi:hypothetical protein